MTVRTYVDPLGPIKTWLQGQSVTGIQGVHLGDPTDADLPYLSLVLVDGPLDAGGDNPLALPHVQITVQGVTLLDASLAAWDLVSKIESLGGVTMTGGLRCHSARRILGPVSRADERGARMVTEFEFAMVAP